MLDQEHAKHWRTTTPARVVAVGFIIVILMGNLWLALALIGAPVQPWLAVAFVVGIAVVLLGGGALGFCQIQRLYQSNKLLKAPRGEGNEDV